ncbi:hypothetical protein H0H92_003455 [Tricholoma furcatifolium]|nr:hypothetical protein H0H92_003455 [Tricholoma furcatifolium]
MQQEKTPEEKPEILGPLLSPDVPPIVHYREDSAPDDLEEKHTLCLPSGVSPRRNDSWIDEPKTPPHSIRKRLPSSRERPFPEVPQMPPAEISPGADFARIVRKVRDSRIADESINRKDVDGNGKAENKVSSMQLKIKRPKAKVATPTGVTRLALPRFMDPGPHKLETVKEEGWHIISSNWWHTSYESVPWSFSSDDASKNNDTTSYFKGSLFGAHGSCCDSSRPRHTSGEFPLSIDLSGVRSALDALVKYEMDVGFTPEILDPKPPVDISVAIDEEAVSRGKERWELYAEVLTSGVDSITEVATFEEFVDDTGSRASSPLSSHGCLHRSTSTLSSVDLTDSDVSFKSSSLPSTPKKKSAEAIVEVKGASPVKSDHGHFVFPRSLNAAASCFVPSSTPLQSELASFSYAMPTTSKSSSSPSPAINLPFPTLDVPPLPVVQIKKDENGFYSEAEVAAPVPQTKQESCAFLPPFLQSSSRRKAPVSKTRAMVDRLRSSHSHSHSPSPNPPLYDVNIFDEHATVSEDDVAQSSRISSPEEEEDGWINIAEADRASKEVKARRTRDLFLALTRRRSDPVPPTTNDDPAQNKHPDTETRTTTPPSFSPSPPSPHDGWIDPTNSVTTEVSSQRRTESRSRNRKRRSSHAPPAPSNTASSHFMPAANANANARAASTVPHASFQTPTASFSPPSSASYFYPAYPALMTPVTYTSYMQQLQLMQMQLRTGGGSAGRRTSNASTQEWFQYPTAGAPYTTANTPAPVTTSPTRAARGDSFW